jgi:hypothetical protein
MASAAQLKALFRSHLEGDQERFTAVAQQIVSEAQRGASKSPWKSLDILISSNTLVSTQC